MNPGSTRQETQRLEQKRTRSTKFKSSNDAAAEESRGQHVPHRRRFTNNRTMLSSTLIQLSNPSQYRFSGFRPIGFKKILFSDSNYNG